VNASETVSASFQICHSVTVSSSTGGTAEVTNGADTTCPTGEWRDGASINVFATPDADYSFVSWSGAPIDGSTNNPQSFTLTADTSLMANFVQTTFHLIVNGGMEDDLDADKIPDDWTLVSPYPGDRHKCNKITPLKIFSHSGDCAFVFVGDTNPQTDKIKQKPIFSGNAGDTIDLSVWTKGIDLAPFSTAKLIARVKDSITGEKEKVSIEFPSDGSWDYTEYTASHVVGSVNPLLTTYDLIKLQIVFNSLTSAKLYVDDVSLDVTIVP
jgi:hypothetical protein